MECRSRYLWGLPPFAAVTLLFVGYSAAVLRDRHAAKALLLSPASVTKSLLSHCGRV